MKQSTISIPKRPGLPDIDSFIRGAKTEAPAQKTEPTRELTGTANINNDGIKIFPLRLTASVHRVAKQRAKREDMSLHSYIIKLILDDSNS